MFTKIYFLINNKTLKKVTVNLFPKFNLSVVVLEAVLSLEIHKHDFPCRGKLVQRVQQKVVLESFIGQLLGSSFGSASSL